MFGLKTALNFANWDATPQNSVVRSFFTGNVIPYRGDPPEDANATAVQGREGHKGGWHGTKGMLCLLGLNPPIATPV